MNALTIILLIYVILDIVASIVIYAILRLNGWNMASLAYHFRNLLKKPADDFIEDVVDEYTHLL